MSDSLIEDTCFLCGCNARSGTYNRDYGKVFIECANEACGEYLITNSAMRHLTNGERKKEFSRMATSKKEIQDSWEILVIAYHGGIKAEFKRLENVLPSPEIDLFGFRRRDT
jgi:hypothetical protein